MTIFGNSRNDCHKHQAATMTTPEVGKTANKPPSCTVVSVYRFLSVAHLPQFPPCTEGTVHHMPLLGHHDPLAIGARLAPPTCAAVCMSLELLHAWPAFLLASPVPEHTQK